MHPAVKMCAPGAGCTLNFGHCIKYWLLRVGGGDSSYNLEDLVLRFCRVLLDYIGWGLDWPSRTQELKIRPLASYIISFYQTQIATQHTLICLQWIHSKPSTAVIDCNKECKKNTRPLRRVRSANVWVPWSWMMGALIGGSLYRVPTQIAFSNSLSFPCLTTNFPCANLRDL